MFDQNVRLFDQNVRKSMTRNIEKLQKYKIIFMNILGSQETNKLLHGKECKNLVFLNFDNERSKITK